jgi:large subunit ribosomal protein L9
VTARDVADAIQAEGGKVERSQVVLNNPIKTLGVHDVKVRLHAEVTITVKINVARSMDEAERQAAARTSSSQFDEGREIAAEQAADMVEGGAGQQEFLGEEA